MDLSPDDISHGHSSAITSDAPAHRLGRYPHHERVASWWWEIGHCLTMIIRQFRVAAATSSRALGTVRAQIVTAHVGIGVEALEADRQLLL
jgi:hypothetical protein